MQYPDFITISAKSTVALLPPMVLFRISKMAKRSYSSLIVYIETYHLSIIIIYQQQHFLIDFPYKTHCSHSSVLYTIMFHLCMPSDIQYLLLIINHSLVQYVTNNLIFRIVLRNIQLCLYYTILKTSLHRSQYSYPDPVIKPVYIEMLY